MTHKVSSKYIGVTLLKECPSNLMANGLSKTDLKKRSFKVCLEPKSDHPVSYLFPVSYIYCPYCGGKLHPDPVTRWYKK